ncbi:MAG TPA: POTRA domain-containing protein [Kofleriaceae bacterium]|nr:POTRA domain-containing protein [Kofleriaceae bacterium]
MPRLLRSRLRLRRAARPFLLAAALGAGASAVAACGAHAPPIPADQRRIGTVDLKGTPSVDDDELHDGLGLVSARERGQPFAPFLVAQDRMRIEGYYLRHGFLGVAIEPTIERHGKRADVTFNVTEGKRAKLARVEFHGLPSGSYVKEADLRKLIPLDDGDPFDYQVYEEARPKIPLALAEAGYARAKVEGVVLADRQRSRVVIRLDVDLGPRTRFGDVKLVGVPAGLEDAVRNRLKIGPGKLYSPRALEDTRSLLYEMGRFSMVRVELDQTAAGEATRYDPRTGDELANVVVTVTPQARHDLRLGGGVGLDPFTFEVRGRAVHSVAGWPWPKTTARAEFRPAVAFQRDDGSPSPRIEASAALDRLDFLRPRWNGAVEARYSYLTVEAYTTHGPSLRLSARTPLYRRSVQASAGWQLELANYIDLSPALDPGLIKMLGLGDDDRIGSFDQSLMIDLRDDRLKTRQGGYLDLRAEEGTPAAGGDGSFLSLMPDLRGYASAGPLTLAMRARAGWLTGDVPATRRFFGGGAGGYRGLPGRQLSPFAVSPDGMLRVPYGGTALLDVSTELRFPITTWRDLGFGGAVFLDGGDVTNGWDELDVHNLHWATGFGIRVQTLIGAVRADLAYRLTRTGPDDPQPGDHFAYHLGIGEAF